MNNLDKSAGRGPARGQVLAQAARILASLDGAAQTASSLERLSAELGASGACLYRSDPVTGTSRLVAAPGWPGETKEELPRDAPGPLSQALATGRADAQESAGPGPSCLVLPLHLGDSLWGVWATSYPAPHRFSNEDLATAMAVGDLLALALSRADASEGAQDLLAQLERLSAGGAAIAEALAVLPETQLRAAVQRGFHVWPYARADDLPEFLTSILHTFVEQARRATGAQYAALGIGASPERPFEPWVFLGMDPKLTAVIGHPPRPVGTLGVVAVGGQTVRVQDIHKHPAFLGLPAGHPEMASFLGVPIRYRELTLGNLYLANKLGAAEFSVADERITEAFAAQAGLALQLAYLRTATEAQGAQLQSVLEDAPVGILYVDARKGHLMANPRAMELLGRAATPEAGWAQYRGIVCDPGGRPLSLDELPSSEERLPDATTSRELLLVQPGGQRIPVLERAAPVRGLDGKTLGVMVIFEEISALKELDRTREDFAAMVAHDLRNPIQTILLQIQDSLRREVRDQVKLPVAQARRIERSAVHLALLVDQLLDVTRLESKQLMLQRSLVNVREVTGGLIDRMRPTLGQHPVEVEAVGPLPMAPLDLLRFDRILTNLVVNAAQHSPDEAPIHVRLAAEEGGIRLSIEDRGEGIAPDELDHLFDRYHQGRKARAGGGQGLGLGLYIAKGLVEAHGGRISVESRLGDGSTFHVWFPSTPLEAEATQTIH